MTIESRADISQSQIFLRHDNINWCSYMGLHVQRSYISDQTIYPIPNIKFNLNPLNETDYYARIFSRKTGEFTIAKWLTNSILKVVTLQQ